MEIRDATEDDAPALAALLAGYLRERFPGHPGATEEQLRRDVLSGAAGQRVVVAVRRGEAIGFAAWDRTYDLHWGVGGALVADLYVAPAHRGRGVALALLAHVCAASRREGGAYLRGGAYDRESPTGRFYERFAVGFDSAEVHCGGRAFRRLAELAGADARTLVRSLPPKEWNYEG